MHGNHNVCTIGIGYNNRDLAVALPRLCYPPTGATASRVVTAFVNARQSTDRERRSRAQTVTVGSKATPSCILLSGQDLFNLRGGRVYLSYHYSTLKRYYTDREHMQLRP